MKKIRRAIPHKLRFEVLERDKYRCVYCGAASADTRIEVDHFHPVSKGGTDDYWNLFAACWECNSAKSAGRLVNFDVNLYRATIAASISRKRLRDLEETFPWKGKDFRDVVARGILKKPDVVDFLAWHLPDPDDSSEWSRSVVDFLNDQFECFTEWLAHNADDSEKVSGGMRSVALALRNVFSEAKRPGGPIQ